MNCVDTSILKLDNLSMIKLMGCPTKMFFIGSVDGLDLKRIFKEVEICLRAREPLRRCHTYFGIYQDPPSSYHWNLTCLAGGNYMGGSVETALRSSQPLALTIFASK